MNISNHRLLRPLMLGGTGSDVGKSLLTAGLCRIFLQDGYSPAPFKAQNMALNSFVTPEGLEIGRAQAVQAEAAGTECRAEMNPVLMKPTGEKVAQVIVLGRPIGNHSAASYFRKDNKRELREIVCKAFDRLAADFNPVVMEGAGSVAELNLLETDIVNMPMALYAGASVILVADIDRGGVFAQAYGSIMLLPEEYRRLIKGIIVNKFRGDISLFDEGRRILEGKCGLPVLGVVPFDPELHIEEEDRVSVLARHTCHTESGLVNVAVVGLRHLSNFTDFDNISRDPRVHIYLTADPAEISAADIIILPGSKNTLGDLHALRSNGCAEAIRKAAASGKTVFGICGGYQMMGRTVADPEGVEGEPSTAEGLGLLPAKTVLSGTKTTVRTRFRLPGLESLCEGYEIHNGLTSIDPCAQAMVYKEDGTSDGCKVSEKVMGCYMHGILDNQEVVDMIVGPYASLRLPETSAPGISYREFKETQYDRLAAHLRKHLDIERIYQIMRGDD